MRKIAHNTIFVMLVVVSVAALCAGNAYAQDNSISGKTYAMYFLSFPNNNFNDLEDAGLTHLDFTFKEDGGVAAMDMDGHGLYFAMPGFFAATYYVVGLRMGFERMDVFTGMTGISINPLMFGVGFFLLDYSQIQPYVFSGLMVQEIDNTLM
jgi:hypothetical protein